MTMDEKMDGAAAMMIRMREGGESGVALTKHLAEGIVKEEFHRQETDAAALEFDEIFNAKVDRVYDEISRRAATLRPDLFDELRIEGPFQTP